MHALSSPGKQHAASRWSLLHGSLLYAIAYSLPFIMIVISPYLNLGEEDLVDGLLFFGAILIGMLAGGALFGRTAAGVIGSALKWRAAIVGGVTLLLMTFAGLALAILGETVPVPGLSTHGLFTVVFPLMSALVLLVVTGLLGWALSVKRPFLRALPAAGLTWIAYMVAIYLLNLLFHWQVGSGNRAMVKVAMVGDLVAAVAGSALWIANLRRTK